LGGSDRAFDIEVRLAVAQSLPNGVEPDGPLRDAVIAALMRLTHDEEFEVRNWACFGLGDVGAASPAATDALAARLADSDNDTRCEALLALARTDDPRAGAALRHRLAHDPADQVFLLEVRAAAEIADPGLHPLLLALSQDWGDDDDEFTPVLAFAMSRCRPDAKDRAIAVERELVTRVNTLLGPQGPTATLAGEYPRSALAFHGVESQTASLVFDPIWPDEDPWDYSLEQQARSMLKPKDALTIGHPWLKIARMSDQPRGVCLMA